MMSMRTCMSTYTLHILVQHCGVAVILVAFVVVEKQICKGEGMTLLLPSPAYGRCLFFSSRLGVSFVLLLLLLLLLPPLDGIFGINLCKDVLGEVRECIGADVLLVVALVDATYEAATM